jgi:hypothetical protein
MWLLLAQFAKEKQRAAQAATGANRPHAELARPRIIPHPVTGTIEFEHGQIVAKMGKHHWCSEWIISTELLFRSLSARRMIAEDDVAQLPNASPLVVARSAPAAVSANCVPF